MVIALYFLFVSLLESLIDLEVFTIIQMSTMLLFLKEVCFYIKYHNKYISRSYHGFVLTNHCNRSTYFLLNIRNMEMSALQASYPKTGTDTILTDRIHLIRQKMK